MNKDEFDEVMRRARAPRTKEQDEGYARTCEAMYRAGADFMRTHPFAEPRFRTEAFEAEIAEQAGRPGQKPFVVAELDKVIDRWADNEDGKALLRAMNDAVKGEGTYAQARAVLEHAAAGNVVQGEMPEGDWRCTSCERVLDGFTAVRGPDGEVATPAPGQPTVCAYCAVALRVNASANGFEPLTDRDLRALPKDLRMKLLSMRNFVRDRLERERKKS